MLSKFIFEVRGAACQEVTRVREKTPYPEMLLFALWFGQLVAKLISPTRGKPMNAPSLELVCRLEVELDTVREMGSGRAGQRRIIPIIGGTVSGPRLSGRILNLGADWQTIFEDGLAELDTRYAFETDDGALIEIINYGFRHGPADVMTAMARGDDVSPEAYYMRTHARLETGDPRYDWVNRALFVGKGHRRMTQVIVDLYLIT
jgi:hypothetical protein